MKHAFALLVAAAALSGCAHKKHAKLVPQPPPTPSTTPSTPASPSASTKPAASAPSAGVPSLGYTENGVASWYGHPYHGRAAANGEIYDMETMVAAHRTLPFDTWVRVYDLDTDKNVDVRIIDRGPFIDGRIIDLSHAAARAIAMIGPGTARVRLEVIGVPQGVLAPVYAVQVGAYRDRDSAERVRSQMAARYGAARLVERAEDPGVWRVMVGAEATQDAANALSTRIRRECLRRSTRF